MDELIRGSRRIAIADLREAWWFHLMKNSLRRLSETTAISAGGGGLIGGADNVVNNKRLKTLPLKIYYVLVTSQK